MRHSDRLERIPPYLFAQLERKIADKRAAGVDVITLAIGDPDTPTYPPIVEAAQRARTRRPTPTPPIAAVRSFATPSRRSTHDASASRSISTAR
jgi:aspartate/methionine/tyrosine aminotransferase